MKRLYNPIAIYNYNKGKYFIALDDGKVVFFKYEDGEMSNDYSKDELEVFYDVYNSLKVDKESAINLGFRRFNGKFFETFYDVKKELYFWYEIIDGERSNVTKEDLELLNYRYNNQCLKYFEDEEGFGNGNENQEPYDWEAYSYLNLDNDNPEQPQPEIYDWAKDPAFSREEMLGKARTFKRAITKYGKTVAIIVVAGVNLVVLTDKILHTDASNRLRSIFGGTSVSDDVKYEEDKGRIYSFEAVNDALNQNENLSSEEKVFFSKFKNYFDDIGPHMDQAAVLNRIKTLKIIYTTDKCKSPDIAGEYDTVENSITIYSTDSFVNCDKSVLAHEFFHVTQKGFSKRLAMELSNEAAAREYIRGLAEEGVLDQNQFKNEYDVPEYGTGYDQCMKVYYLLANLLDQDTLRKYQAVPSEVILTNALVEIESNASKELSRSFGRYEMEKNALELLDFIDELRAEPDEYGYRELSYSDDKYEKICALLDYYYRAKFGKTIDECFVENIMEYDKTYGSISTTTPKGRAIWKVMDNALERAVENLDENYRIPMGEYRFVLPKTYFSDKHENPIVYFNTSEKVSEMSYREFFVGIEITHEMNEEYIDRYTSARQEISNEINSESSKENTDNVGGMGSRDVERD